ncbi:YesL family protein [Brachybacterium sp. YJGR34]|uniref:YesL family protein n=1 Tax=Brachybacterium sp. YJGR34 TaxID=2059911 RepID=UPI000E0C547D|nr:DUF624 domain-containing protein [Brachybacterium sp. YJGR34]
MSTANPARPRRLMPQLVRWHLGLGELALRLFLLNLLWVLGVLAGGIVLGIAPATAALHAVLRQDRIEGVHEAEGTSPPPRGTLWAEFWAAWRGEFVRATRLGAVLATGWALLLADRWVLSALDLGTAGPAASGIVVLLTVALALVTVVVWPLAAHFEDPLRTVLRMVLTVLVARPGLTLSVLVVLGAAAAIWQSLPGLVPVFGLALPCWVVTFLVWRSGVLPRE